MSGRVQFDQWIARKCMFHMPFHSHHRNHAAVFVLYWRLLFFAEMIHCTTVEVVKQNCSIVCGCCGYGFISVKFQLPELLRDELSIHDSRLKQP